MACSLQMAFSLLLAVLLLTAFSLLTVFPLLIAFSLLMALEFAIYSIGGGVPCDEVNGDDDDVILVSGSEDVRAGEQCMEPRIALHWVSPHIIILQKKMRDHALLESRGIMKGKIMCGA